MNRLTLSTENNSLVEWDRAQKRIVFQLKDGFDNNHLLSMFQEKEEKYAAQIYASLYFILGLEMLSKEYIENIKIAKNELLELCKANLEATNAAKA